MLIKISLGLKEVMRRLKMAKQKGWTELMRGGDLPASTAIDNKTGSWRSLRPVFDASNCTHCMMCVLYCPDMAIPIVRNEEGVVGKGGRIYKGNIRLETNFDYCKGCGICAVECPTKCITMVREE